jgi:hypothetical protein
MNRENNPEKSNHSRKIKNGDSTPIPPMRLGGSAAKKPPVKVKLVVSEQPVSEQPVSEQPVSEQPIPQPAHPVRMLVSETPIPIRPQPQPSRRKVNVLIAPHKSLGQSPRIAMTEARPPKTGSWKVRLLVTSLILGSIAIVGSGGVIAALFIFNPAALSWLPGSTKVRHTAQTLKEIKAEAYKAGVFAGDPLYVSSYPGFDKNALGHGDFLMPIYASSMTDKLTELRAYRPTKLGEKTVFDGFC